MGGIARALRTFVWLALPYFRSEDKWRARALLAGVIGAELSVVYLAVLVNQWHAHFFNALDAKDWSALRGQLVVFVFLTVGAIVTGMAQFYFGQTLLIRWREWMTQRYVGLWMAEGRHYRIRFVDPGIDNIHLRIASDVMLFIQRTLELGVGLLSSIVVIVSFSYILWGVSTIAPLPLFGYDLSFPGYLIVFALGYAVFGMTVAHLIGHRLIPLNFNQQRYEADFRFAIARVTDQADPVALMRGEEVERAELHRRFGALIANWITLVGRHTRLNGFIFGYFHVSTVLPILLVTPAFMLDVITLGVLMQASQAFQKVEGAFAFFTSSYAKIAEWKALMDRVAQFEAAMVKVDEPVADGASLQRKVGPGKDLVIGDAVLRLPNGEALAAVPKVRLAPGQRLLVNGRSGSGKSTLVRALTGIWPMGDGRIRVPNDASVLALPQRPYFPLGTLKQALSYPMPEDAVSDEDVRAAMTLVGLGHLTERLEEQGDWSAALSGGEQQRGAFARALINRPTILLLDEPVSTLDDAEARELYRTIVDELPRTTVISIGGAAAFAGLHHRTIEMSGPHAANAMRPVLAAVSA